MIIKKEEGKFRSLASFVFVLLCILVIVILFSLINLKKIDKPISGNVIAPVDDSKEPEIEKEIPEVLKENIVPLNFGGNQTNQTANKKSSGRGSGGGSSGGGSSGGNGNPGDQNPDQSGGTGNQSQGNSTEQNSTENNGNQNGNSPGNGGNNLGQGKMKNKNSGLKLKIGEQELDGTEIFQGKQRFNLGKGTRSIADFDIDFNGDVDLSGLVADVDFNSGKAFMHNPEKILLNITLYIPRLPGQDGVLICSNASTFDQIYVGCGNDTEITSEYILQEGDPNLKISDDGNYFLVRGITGTGGNGVNVSAGPPQTAPSDPAGNTTAFAGNLTYLSVRGMSTTRTWQGYFGNVTGVIELADATGNALYNWSVAEPEGEVYASTNSSLTWTSLQCFNFTANGTQILGSETFGSTSLTGMNLSGLESMFNIASEDIDGVNETFSFTPGGDGHDQFFIANLQFSAGECLSAKTFNSGGGQGGNQFEEVLLWDPSTSSVIFTALLEEGTLNGFNNQDNDFQMLVLEDGHGTNVVSTTYYFFAELQ